MANGPMIWISVALIVFVVIVFGAMSYQQFEFQQTAPIHCKQIVDRFDNITQNVRQGNFVNTVTKYHIYDQCFFKNGTVLSNQSLGYGTELEATLAGLT